MIHKSRFEIEEGVKEIGANLNLLTEYFFELGFAGCVIYNDPAGAVFDWHYHKTDNYLYMLEGGMKVELEDQQTILLKTGDFFFFPANIKHNATILNSGAKYLVATTDGDFGSVKA